MTVIGWGVDPTALEGLNCQQELWNSIRWNFVSALNKKNGSQPIFLEEKMKQVAELDLLEVVGSKNRKKHVPTLHGDEETSIFSKKRVEVYRNYPWLYRFHFFNFPGEWATMTPPYAGTLVGSGSACHLAISERKACQQKHTKNPKVGGNKNNGAWLVVWGCLLGGSC